MRSPSILRASLRHPLRIHIPSQRRPLSSTNAHHAAAKNRIYPSRVRSEDELHTLLLLSASSRVPLLTLWTTTWDPTCRAVTPLLRRLLADERVGEAQGGVGFVEVEFDSPDLGDVALRYGINAIPALLAFDRQEPQIETIVRRAADLQNRDFLVPWIEKEAGRRGEGGAGGSWKGLFGG